MNFKTASAPSVVAVFLYRKLVVWITRKIFLIKSGVEI